MYFSFQKREGKNLFSIIFKRVKKSTHQKTTTTRMIIFIMMMMISFAPHYIHKGFYYY